MKTSHLLTMAFSSILLTPQMKAEVIAADSFTPTPERPAGAAIKGSTPEQGNSDVFWSGGAKGFKGRDTWVIRSDDDQGGIASTQGSESLGLRIPFDFRQYRKHGDVAVIRFRAFYRITSNGWLGFGFGSAENGGLNSTSGALWVKVNPDQGTWELWSNAPGSISGKKTTLPTGTVEGISGHEGSMQWLDYELAYNHSERTVVRLSINDKTVLENYRVPTQPGPINGANIFAQLPYNTPTGNGLDDFELSVTD